MNRRIGAMYTVFIACCFAAFSFQVRAADAPALERIARIRFEGNTITKEEIMRLEMSVHEGDEVDLAAIERSVQQIMDLGIFEKVTYYLESNDADDDIDLVIVVVEPYYWYVLPTFKFNDNSELELGARLRWNNLFGYNHRLVIKGEDKGNAGGVSAYKSEFAYTFHRFLLSRYALSLQAVREQRLDNDNPLGDQREVITTFNISTSKWLNDDGVSSGLFIGFGLGYQRQSNTALSPTDPSDGTFDSFTYRFQFGRDRRHKYEYQRGGDFLVYGLGLFAGVAQHTLTYQRYRILSREQVSNLNYLFSFGYANNDVLGNRAFSLGGNSTLRGYRKGRFHGDVLLRASVEYLTKFNRSPLVRKVVFIDAGETEKRFSDMSLSGIHYGAGVGLRWKARHFVNLDVRLDLAYGFSSQDLRIVLGSRNTF